MDPTLTSPTPPIPAPPRRRWWLRGALMVLALAILVPIALYGYFTYTTRYAWDAAEAEADRTDPEWRMTPILAARKTMPDKENSALHIIAIAGKAPKVRLSGAPNYEEIFAKLPPNAQLNAQQMQLLRGELDKIAGPIEEARQLKKYPYGRFPIKIDAIFFATLLPDHQKSRELMDWLKHDAYRLAQEEKIDDAVESCRACLCLGRAMGDEPIIISHLIRISIQLETIAALERVLAQGKADETTLAKMQALVELESKESTWLQSLRGERAGSQNLFEGLRTGKIPIRLLRSIAGAGPMGKGPSLSEWMADKFPSTYVKYYPEYLEHMTRCVEIAKLPLHEQRPKIQACDKEKKESSNPILGLMAPNLSHVYQAECRSQAHLRAAAAAIACERYRLAHGSWPDSFDVLVEKKLLDAAPIDPIDGKPLRYRQDRDFVVIYSIGDDEMDNGGHIDRERMSLPGVDIGFRLWNPEQRRRAPRPIVVIREGNVPN